MRCSTALMAALLLLLVSLAAADIPIPAADIHMPYRDKSEEEMRLIFVEWKANMGKTYSSAGEEERRYATFKDSLRRIDQHNAAGIHSYRLGLNNFSDLTQEEFSATPCLVIQSVHDKDKAAWRLITYMLFVCGFLIVYFIWTNWLACGWGRLFVLQRKSLLN
ncbi:hypothetical protein QYE76_016644 [Lolium multiflorum]|uniref:Cathepsin propeptide inhibitor domain-containing protein n=1 Tax=Lolium multiflorum TaxID=4521 RepID=A0AAD8VDX4_LOLMU|nr:hypothetical protein QYE76_016644 [Lolium multiflorum]